MHSVRHSPAGLLQLVTRLRLSHASDRPHSLIKRLCPNATDWSLGTRSKNSCSTRDSPRSVDPSPPATDPGKHSIAPRRAAPSTVAVHDRLGAGTPQKRFRGDPTWLSRVLPCLLKPLDTLSSTLWRYYPPPPPLRMPRRLPAGNPHQRVWRTQVVHRLAPVTLNKALASPGTICATAPIFVRLCDTSPLAVARAVQAVSIICMENDSERPSAYRQA